ncbi:6-bladed beta-propeller [Chryseolinea lacunae]|uniref:6-bladed beta-propeller n=1 Tax=Chryseolinea lacunae TaxID=2801331 RepID=A0ABS1KZU5_9BACT|nr:6-bladed beta-propeller [Chryseolinea lacunae]MBL0744762.1 6-bladed beta-propeller [Chryseolinea lacunae]
MKRSTFIRQTALASMASLTLTRDLMARATAPVYGHGNMKYTLDTKWSKADPLKNPVNDCHEMVQDASGKILLLTNETKNNVMVFNTSGKLLNTWGHEFPGAHGLTLAGDTLFITDTAKHQVYKASLKGEVLLTIDPPQEDNLYPKADQFVPTEVAVLDNGDFYIADGYGSQYILQYDAAGKLKGYFGGRGEGDEKLDNAHGIVVDKRKGEPTLLVTDRTRNCFKRFTLDGKLIEIIQLPGACVCRPVIKGDHLYAAVLRSPNLNTEGTGFITILDKDNKVVSNIGGTAPTYVDGKLQPMAQAEKLFIHPHDVCIDRDDNLYVAQWASGKVYPYKLNRV